MKSVHVIIKGRVQGVGFRNWTYHTAQDLGVGGWVRNLPDGSVEACFEGEETNVNAMLEAAKRGPAYAKVTDLIVAEAASVEEFQDFQIR